MASEGFHDHFSALAGDYARYRPAYPAELFAWLAQNSPGRELAWDCACGSGQATRGMARHFKKVIGSDASEKQIEQAQGPINVFYQVAGESDPFLPDGAVDLVTCAQAAHWLDLDNFYSCIQQKLKPRGLLAIWSYGLFETGDGIEKIVSDYYHDIVGPYWPPQRRWVEQGYQGLPFPFAQISAPPFSMSLRWKPADLYGYLGTWSAAKEYQKARGEDPRKWIQKKLVDEWGTQTSRVFTWKLALKAGHLPG
jgi:SAM-dependent methyltransferase